MRVKDGIVANNLLPFGTEIKLPGIFGDKVLLFKTECILEKVIIILIFGFLYINKH